MKGFIHCAVSSAIVSTRFVLIPAAMSHVSHRSPASVCYTGKWLKALWYYAVNSVPSKGGLSWQMCNTVDAGTPPSLHPQTSFPPYFTHGWLTEHRSGRPLYTVQCRSFQAGTWSQLSELELMKMSDVLWSYDLVRLRITPASCSPGKRAEIGTWWQDKEQLPSNMSFLAGCAQLSNERHRTPFFVLKGVCSPMVAPFFPQSYSSLPLSFYAQHITTTWEHQQV